MDFGSPSAEQRAVDNEVGVTIGSHKGSAERSSGLSVSPLGR
jgi:hypothetical protein